MEIWKTGFVGDELERDDFVLDILALLELIDGIEGSHFPLQIHPAQSYSIC